MEEARAPIQNKKITNQILSRLFVLLGKYRAKIIIFTEAPGVLQAIEIYFFNKLSTCK